MYISKNKKYTDKAESLSIQPRAQTTFSYSESNRLKKKS